MTVKYSVEDTAVEYRVSMNLSLCEKGTHDSNCSEIEVVTDLPLKKSNCQHLNSRRKRHDIVM